MIKLETAVGLMPMGNANMESGERSTVLQRLTLTFHSMVCFRNWGGVQAVDAAAITAHRRGACLACNKPLEVRDAS